MKTKVNKSQANKVSALAVVNEINQVINSIAGGKMLTYKGYTISYTSLADMVWQGIKGINRIDDHNNPALKYVNKSFTTMAYSIHNHLLGDSCAGNKFSYTIAKNENLTVLQDVIMENFNDKGTCTDKKYITINGKKVTCCELSLCLHYSSIYLIEEARTTTRGTMRTAMLITEGVQARFLCGLFHGDTPKKALDGVLNTYTGLERADVISIIDSLKIK